jgi:hypothetical protein
MLLMRGTVKLRSICALLTSFSANIYRIGVVDKLYDPAPDHSSTRDLHPHSCP